MTRPPSDVAPGKTQHSCFSLFNRKGVPFLSEILLTARCRGFTCGAADMRLCTSEVTSGDVLTGKTFSLRCESSETTATVGDDQQRPVSAHRLLLIQGSGRPVPETAAPTPEWDDDGHDGSGGIPTGGKVAIGIGCAIFFLALACASCMFYRGIIRKINKSSKKATAQGGTGMHSESLGLMHDQADAGTNRPEPSAQGLLSTGTGLDSFGPAPPTYEEAIELDERSNVRPDEGASSSNGGGEVGAAQQKMKKNKEKP